MNAKAPVESLCCSDVETTFAASSYRNVRARHQERIEEEATRNRLCGDFPRGRFVSKGMGVSM